MLNIGSVKVMEVPLKLVNMTYIKSIEQSTNNCYELTIANTEVGNTGVSKADKVIAVCDHNLVSNLLIIAK